MARYDNPSCVDTVIIGNGPAALLLSYILHGNIPYYKGGHHDSIIDQRLKCSPNLLAIPPRIYHHLASSVRYTTQALPVNALLDALILPYGEADFEAESCVEWLYEPDKAVPHVVLGNASRAGGLWADNPVKVGQDIGTLSYSEQLNLPGYSFGDHWLATKKTTLPELIRPTRHEITEYFAAYPAAVDIQESIKLSTKVLRVARSQSGFKLSPQNIECKYLVLATGIFNLVVPPPPLLQSLSCLHEDEGPLLVIGSGFTAADKIISTPAHRHIIHIFNWDPENHPSPLKACHHRAYPEYAFIYRQMAYAAYLNKPYALRMERPVKPKGFKTQFEAFAKRDWQHTYEGYPNSRVIQIVQDEESQSPSRAPPSTLEVQIGRSSIGPLTTRVIGSFFYAAGRRGSLSYLSPSLLHEVLPAPANSVLGMEDLNGTSDKSEALQTALHSVPETPSIQTMGQQDLTQHSGHATTAPVEQTRRSSDQHDFALETSVITPELISGQTLRPKIEEAAFNESSKTATGLEVAEKVFVIGSLTGDSLVRFAYGGCAAVAGKIMGAKPSSPRAGIGSRPASAHSSCRSKPSTLEKPHPVHAHQQVPIVDQMDRHRQQERDLEQLIHPVTTEGDGNPGGHHPSKMPNGELAASSVAGGQKQNARKNLWRHVRHVGRSGNSPGDLAEKIPVREKGHDNKCIAS